MWVGSYFFCFSSSSLTSLEGISPYLCSLAFSSPPQLFLMFPQLLPGLACLERPSSPDCALADSATTSCKLPTYSCFHLLEPPVSQSCPGDQQSDRICLLLARNLLSFSVCLLNVSAGDAQHARMGLYPDYDRSYDFCPPGILEDHSYQCCSD